MQRDVAGRNGIVVLAFLAGGLVGAMAALLAPQSSWRMRSRIATQIRDGLRRSRRDRPRSGKKRRENADAALPNGGTAPVAGATDASAASSDKRRIREAAARVPAAFVQNPAGESK